MPGGSSLQMVSNKREALAASVTIALTNNTSEVLEARRQWVKGGEAVNLAVRTNHPKMGLMINGNYIGNNLIVKDNNRGKICKCLWVKYQPCVSDRTCKFAETPCWV